MPNNYPLPAPRFRVNTLGFHLMEHFRHSFKTFVLADQPESDQNEQAVELASQFLAQAVERALYELPSKEGLNTILDAVQERKRHHEDEPPIFDQDVLAALARLRYKPVFMKGI